MISASDLADAQQDAQLALITKCNVVKRTVVNDSWGGSAATYVVEEANVPCSVVGTTGTGEIDQAGRVTAISAWVINVPVGTTVTPEHHIQIGTSIYEVIQILADPAGLTITIPLLCRKAE